MSLNNIYFPLQTLLQQNVKNVAIYSKANANTTKIGDNHEANNTHHDNTSFTLDKIAKYINSIERAEDDKVCISLNIKDAQGYKLVTYNNIFDTNSSEFQSIDSAITNRLSNESPEVAFSSSRVGALPHIEIKATNPNCNNITLKPHTYSEKAQSLLTFTKNMEQ
ncbi:MAG: hypothetical protein ACI9CD_000872 [Candidatus Deianiraeaceae bacterium]|jgi:hypothetical protein